MPRGFPRLYAAASLKPIPHVRVVGIAPRFPRLYAAASLKPARHQPRGQAHHLFSAALCRGLIEADYAAGDDLIWREGFPRLYAAALLKPTPVPEEDHKDGSFPRLYAAASLKRVMEISGVRGKRRFPRLYAAASLKPRWRHRDERRLCDVFRGFMPRPH